MAPRSENLRMTRRVRMEWTKDLLHEIMVLCTGLSMHLRGAQVIWY
jgi:hypothetical protein